MKVWAITSGSYSDYRVLAVFPTECDAKAAVELARTVDVGWSAADSVTTLHMYDEGEIPQVVTVYDRQVTIWDDGTYKELPTREHRCWEYDEWYPTPADGRPKVRFVRAPVHKGKGGRLEISGRNEQAVNQSFSDNLYRIVVQAETTGKARG